MATKRTRTRSSNGANGSNHSVSSLASPSLQSRLSQLDESTIQDSLVDSFASSVLERLQFAIDNGLTSYDGKRDLFTALGYKKKLEFEDFYKRYKRGGIARRIVTFLPKRVWSGQVEIFDDPDPDTITPFQSRIEYLFKTLKIKSRLKKAHVLAMLGRYSCILIGPGRGSLDTELKSGPVTYLTPLSERRCVIKEKDKSINSDRFGLPLLYTIPPMEGENDKELIVHHSRIIHIARDPLENDVTGDPILESIWNDLDDLYKISGGGAESRWRNSRLLHIKLDPKYKASPGSEKKLQDNIDEMRHGQRDTLKTKGVDIESIATSGSSFADDQSAKLDLIAGTIDLPKRRLMGSERGDMASSQDAQHEQETVSTERDECAEPALRDLIDRLISISVVPEPINQEYEVAWPEEDTMTENESAELVNQLADANEKMFNSRGGIIITADEIRDKWLKMGPIEQEQKDEQEEEEDIELDLDPEETFQPNLRANASNDRIKSLHKIVDSSIPSFASTMDAYWSDLAEQLIDKEWSLDSISTTIREVFESIPNTAIESKILSTLVDGSSIGGKDIKRLNRSTPLRVQALDIVLDTSNPLALTYARARAAELVQEIASDMILSVRSLVIDSINEGYNRQQLAKSISQSVGLHSDQLKAVNRLREELMSAQPGTLITRIPPRDRLRDMAGFRAKVPKGGATQAWVDKNVERYARISRNYRSRRIARTELTSAANEGQRLLWAQSQEKGLLPNDIKRVWLSNTKRHAHMEGQKVGINEQFNPAIEPGQETNCGCSQALDI